MNARMSRFRVVAIFPALLCAAIGGPAVAAGAEVVKFRLSDWRSQHFENEAQAKTFVDTVTHLGCEAKAGAHGGHIDVTYRCSDWRALQAASHESAHAWENWLKQAGFETRHEH